MTNWISVENEKPPGRCLVVLSEEVSQNIMHTACFNGNIEIVGGAFSWDMPNVTHWQPLPEPPL